VRILHEEWILGSFFLVLGEGVLLLFVLFLSYSSLIPLL
jgi:hypothetical protein